MDVLRRGWRDFGWIRRMADLSKWLSGGNEGGESGVAEMAIEILGGTY